MGKRGVPKGYKQSSDFEARFWPKAEYQDGCVIWKASINPAGYGMFMLRKKPRPAQRVAYALLTNQDIDLIPKQWYVCHSCDNRKCIRPSHLFSGSAKDNMADCVEKGRIATKTNGRHGSVIYPEAIPCGSRNHSSKVTEMEIREARILHVAGWSNRTLARKYGLSEGTMSEILNRKLWRSVV